MHSNLTTKKLKCKLFNKLRKSYLNEYGSIVVINIFSQPSLKY